MPGTASPLVNHMAPIDFLPPRGVVVCAGYGDAGPAASVVDNVSDVSERTYRDFSGKGYRVTVGMPALARVGSMC